MTTPLLTTKLDIPHVRPNLLTVPVGDQAAMHALLMARNLGDTV